MIPDLIMDEFKASITPLRSSGATTPTNAGGILLTSRPSFFLKSQTSGLVTPQEPATEDDLLPLKRKRVRFELNIFDEDSQLQQAMIKPKLSEQPHKDKTSHIKSESIISEPRRGRR